MRRFGVSAEELVPPPADYVDPGGRRGAPGGAFGGPAGPARLRGCPGPADARRGHARWWPAWRAVAVRRGKLRGRRPCCPRCSGRRSTSTSTPTPAGRRPGASPPIRSASWLPPPAGHGQSGPGTGVVRRAARPRPAQRGPPLNEAAVDLAYKHCERDHPFTGAQLLLRDPAAAPAQALSDVRPVRHGTADRRRRRRPALRVQAEDRLAPLERSGLLFRYLSGRSRQGCGMAAVPPGDPVLIALADASRELRPAARRPGGAGRRV